MDEILFPIKDEYKEKLKFDVDVEKKEDKMLFEEKSGRQEWLKECKFKTEAHDICFNIKEEEEEPMEDLSNEMSDPLEEEFSTVPGIESDCRVSSSYFQLEKINFELKSVNNLSNNSDCKSSMKESIEIGLKHQTPLNRDRERLFRCKICDFKTNSDYKINLHYCGLSEIRNQRMRDSGLESNIDKYPEIETLKQSSKKQFKCSECSYETSRKGHLNRHLLIHSNTKLFKCSECDFETNRKGGLKSHILKHIDTKLFKCSMCDYETNLKKSLDIHVLKHSGTKLLKCSECEYATNTKSSLKVHVLKHNDTKLFKCSECDYETNQRGTFNVHLLKHNDTKLLKCTECDFETNHKSNLKIHELKHCDKRLYKCSNCSYETNWKKNLNIHLLKHNDTKLYKCSKCDYGTNWKNDLRTHTLKHSNIFFECFDCKYKTDSEKNFKHHLSIHCITSRK